MSSINNAEYELIPSSDDHHEERERHFDSNIYHKGFQRCPKVALLVVLCIITFACWRIYGYIRFPSVPQNTGKNIELNKTMPSKGKYSVG